MSSPRTVLPLAARPPEARGERPLEVWGGVERTVNRVGDDTFDRFDRNGHARRLDDLDRFADLGIRALRTPVLWERVAPKGLARANWAWPDAALGRMRSLGMEPVVGLVHHRSGPRTTSPVDPGFPAGLAAFARAVAERYPDVDAYTPVNEPLTTARFSGLYGHWYPHGRDGQTFALALVTQIQATVEATVEAMRAILEVNPTARLVQTDDLGRTWSGLALASLADAENERRWLTWDLFCGRVDRYHAMWGPLVGWGIAERELDALADGRTVAARTLPGAAVYLADAVHAALDLLVDGERDVWHLSTPGGERAADLLRAAAQRVGLDAHLVLGSASAGVTLASRRGDLLAPLGDTLDHFFDRDAGWAPPTTARLATAAR